MAGTRKPAPTIETERLRLPVNGDVENTSGAAGELAGLIQTSG